MFHMVVEASAKLPFYYARPNPFLCLSSLSDCNVWTRSGAGYVGAFGSSGKTGTDQIESEVGINSKRRYGKNSGWNTERVTKPAGHGSATPAQRRSRRAACAGSRHSESVADLLG